MLERAYVPRPRLVGQPFHRGVAQSHASAEPASEPRGEVARQGDDVLSPLGERGEVNGHHMQPIEQIVSEPTRRRLGREVPGGRGEEAHVDAPGLLVPYPSDLALLQNPQQLRLQRLRQLSDLIQQQRASVGLLEQPRAVPSGAGERPFHVAEQLRLEQCVGDRSAVHRDEGTRRPGTGSVDRLRDDLFPRAALPSDQHRRGVAGHAPYDLQRVSHGGALGDQDPGGWRAV